MTDQTRSDVSPIVGGLAPSLRHTSPAVAPALLTTIHHGERNLKIIWGPCKLDGGNIGHSVEKMVRLDICKKNPQPQFLS